MIMVPQLAVQIYSESRHDLPSYGRLYDSGMDVYANLKEAGSVLQLYENAIKIIPTGLYVSIPPGYELQVRPRSGTSFKTNLRVCNSPGTIDSGYRGEIGIIMQNIGQTLCEIQDGERIAQLVLAPVFKCIWQPVLCKEDLGDTPRGVGGFGSTGK